MWIMLRVDIREKTLTDSYVWNLESIGKAYTNFGMKIVYTDWFFL